jgi:hypothetical protein
VKSPDGAVGRPSLCLAPPQALAAMPQRRHAIATAERIVRQRPCRRDPSWCVRSHGTAGEIAGQSTERITATAGRAQRDTASVSREGAAARPRGLLRRGERALGPPEP